MEITVEQAEKKLNKVLKKYKIDRIISVEKIRELLIQEFAQENPFYDQPILKLIINLTPHILINDVNANEISSAVFNYENALIDAGILVNPNKTKEKNAEDKSISDYAMETFKAVDFSYFDHYEKAAECYKNRDFLEAESQSKKIFKSLNEEKIIPYILSELLTFYGLISIYNGFKTRANFFLDKAFEIKPKNVEAKKLLDDLKNGQFDEILKIGRFTRIEALNKLHKEKEDIYPLDVVNWSTNKILNKFEEYGVEIDKKEFVKVAEETKDLDKLIERLIDPEFECEHGFEEDYTWMGAQELWVRWCPEIPATEVLAHFGQIFDFSNDLYANEKLLSTYFDRLILMIENMDKKVLKNWKDMWEFDEDVYFIREYMVYDFKETKKRSLEEVVKIFNNNIETDYFSIVPVAAKLRNGEEWEADFRKLLKNDRSDFYLFFYIGGLLESEEMTAVEDETIEDDNKSFEYYMKAYEVIIEHVGSEDSSELSKCEEAHDFLKLCQTLIGAHKDVRDFNGVEKFSELAFELEVELEKESVDLEDDMSLEDALKSVIEEGVDDKIELKMLENDPAYKYLEFIEKYDLDFSNEEQYTPEFAKKLEEENADLLGFNYKPAEGYEVDDESGSYVRKDEKVGRNDPCPCGSGKKYKKCCLRKDR